MVFYMGKRFILRAQENYYTRAQNKSTLSGIGITKNVQGSCWKNKVGNGLRIVKSRFSQKRTSYNSQTPISTGPKSTLLHFSMS